MTVAEDPRSVTWHYNDNFFSSFDWTKEPKLSLPDLYRKKAEQLRNDYDYIILMYSGGSDSGNILETFVQNNIYLDEVCHLINVAGSGDKDSFHNREIFTIANPRIKQYVNQYNLKTKIRLVDISQSIVDFYGNKENKFDFVHYVNSFGSAFCQSKCDLENLIPEWKSLLESGKKVCIIWGCEKPRLNVSNKGFYFHFYDTIDGSMSLRNQLTGPSTEITNELFYWSPTKESADILIKQSHVIKNFLLTNHEGWSPKHQYHPDEEMSVSWVLLGMGKYLVKNNDFPSKISKFGGNDIKELIYPYWNRDEEIMLKSPTGNFLSKRDEWFWKKTNEPMVETFLGGLDHLTNNIKPDWIESYFEFQDKKYPKSIVRILTKPYALQ